MYSQSRNLAVGDRVHLGSGETGRITQSVERDGLQGYRVKILDGPRKGAVVGASSAAMTKVGSRTASLRVRVGSKSFVCRTAHTPTEHALGLQGSTLDPDEGLLFDFGVSRAACFHMGKVAYPIDIVFVHEGHVVQVVANAQPGSADRWTHPCVDHVIEVRGGASGAEVGQRVAFEPLDEDRYRIRFPHEIEDETGDPTERFEDRGIPPDVSPNADEMSPDKWDSQSGADQSAPQYRQEDAEWAVRSGQLLSIEDPGTLIAGIVEAMTREDEPLDWERDLLSPKWAYATVRENDVRRWLSAYDLAPTARDLVDQTVTSKRGMQLIGDAFVLLGLAQIAHLGATKSKEQALILWKEMEKLQ